jgi:ribosomal protein S27AE
MVDLCKIATEAIANSYRAQHHTGSLRMTCSRCTAEQYFSTVIRTQAVLCARLAGWVLDETSKKEICPKCAAARA